jgi:hypothetical protein
MIKEYDVVYEHLECIIGKPLYYKEFEEKVFVFIYMGRDSGIHRDSHKFQARMITSILMNWSRT